MIGQSVNHQICPLLGHSDIDEQAIQGQSYGLETGALEELDVTLLLVIQ